MEEIINGRFVIHKKLGEGGFGEVFLVYDKVIKTVCALKLLRRELSSSKDLHNRFLQEATTWMEFGKHPNIVNVLAVDIFNGDLFLTLEFIPPNQLQVNTLDKQIRVATPTLRQMVQWSLDICEDESMRSRKG